MFVVYRGFYQVLVLLPFERLANPSLFFAKVPSHNRRPESAVLYLVDYSSNVVPSIKESYLLKWLNFEMFGHGWRSHTRSYSYTFFSQAWIDIHFCNTHTVHSKKNRMEKMDTLNFGSRHENGTQWVLFGFVCPTEELAKMAWGMWNSLSNCMKPLILLRCSRGRFLLSSEVPEKTRDSDGICKNCRRTDIITCNFTQTVHVQGLYLLYPFVNICANKKPGRDKWCGVCYWLSRIGLTVWSEKGFSLSYCFWRIPNGPEKVNCR